jgi:hypothetical protein
MAKIDQLSKQLSQTSVKKVIDTYSEIEWPESVDRNIYFYSPEYISIFHTDEYAGLSEEKKKDLSFFEAVNFFSLNIHGERALMEGLAQRLHRKWSPEVSEYIHHFLDEENKHMFMFATFSEKYAGKIYHERKFPFPKTFEKGEEDFLFFAKVVVFEEFVESINRAMAKDDRLHPLAKQIHAIHSFEESRHLAFGREMVKKLYLEFKPTWSEESVKTIDEYLRWYALSTWKEYYNPEVYKDVGFENGYKLMEKAWKLPASLEFRKKHSQKISDFLLENGITSQELGLT